MTTINYHQDDKDDQIPPSAGDIPWRDHMASPQLLGALSQSVISGDAQLLCK